ncbi:cysteine--tRNA ligase [Candidatus Marsarchaeota archaeon]|nr:cysteine--tRNA ligase [Candidatus Marsarchaeota archaeon]
MVRIFNTLGGKKEEFKPIEPKKIKMFVCGSTVYDDAHMGHARTYIAFDVIAKWLRHLGYDVNYIQNITDVDDKIIAKAKERGEDPVELARRYEARLMEDMKALGIDSVNAYPRSHDYIGAIKDQIQLLFDKGYAYPLDGDVYYDVAKFKDYRKLSGMKLEELENHRVEPKEGKRNVYDFALWKASRPGEPSWEISITINGKEEKLTGRPAWHIEDTAITYSIFGPQYDIHGGARELLFPHHTNEIAQAEAAFGVVPFVRYWLHSGVLNVKGQKMSKSLKNFVTIREALAKYSAQSIRLLVCSTHYRKEINYAEGLMEEASRLVSYINQSLGILYNMAEDESHDGSTLWKEIEGASNEFEGAMNDDFNTSLALTSLISMMKSIRRFSEQSSSIDSKSKTAIMAMVKELGGGILGILDNHIYTQRMPNEAKALIEERELARKAKDFKKSDSIRDTLKNRYGIIIEDTKHGPIWKAEPKGF